MAQVCEKNFKTCVQIIVDSSNRRMDDLSKQVYDLKVSLEMTQKEFDDFKVSKTVMKPGQIWTPYAKV